MRTPVRDWCDVVHVLLTEIPRDRLVRIRDAFTTADAIADPDRARETWGALPEHVAMAGPLEEDPAAGLTGELPAMPSGTRR